MHCHLVTEMSRALTRGGWAEKGLGGAVWSSCSELAARGHHTEGEPLTRPSVRQHAEGASSPVWCNQILHCCYHLARDPEPKKRVSKLWWWSAVWQLCRVGLSFVHMYLSLTAATAPSGGHQHKHLKSERSWRAPWWGYAHILYATVKRGRGKCTWGGWCIVPWKKLAKNVIN